jgi:uncharacterized protein YdiU (UPF0061 family)
VHTNWLASLRSPLPDPLLVSATTDFAQQVGLTEGFLNSKTFLDFFSGHTASMGSFTTWATPYALSIYGQEMYDNCPFKNGNGYGDGRAISIAEIINDLGQRWEFQLKGGGRTPFCRGGDGRAVLRSSVREYLASEAMFHLGVETTRAISLIMSQSSFVSRPWFSGANKVDINDPRLQMYPLEVKKQIVKEVSGEPDIMVKEPIAICCRVAPSFIRVGHIELFARRYASSLRSKSPDAPRHRSELKQIVEHLMFREFGHQVSTTSSTQDREGFQTDVINMLRESSRRISSLTASWIRVGFCQGNFNSDNCLVAGRTMDYGPFGFIERYEKNWNMWTGGGQKFSFRNQHVAGGQNFTSFAKAVSYLLNDEGKSLVKDEIIPEHFSNSEFAVNDVFRQKLGLKVWTPEIASLFSRIDDLMETCGADYTIFWRQLSYLPEKFLPNAQVDGTVNISNSEIMDPLRNAFYDDLSAESTDAWSSILRDWLKLVQNDIRDSEVTPALVSRNMRLVSPKYVPREWMLVDAYSAARQNNFEPLNRLKSLFQRPYDEQIEEETLFYKKMQVENFNKGGVACMT